jgi:hypothetical protein
VEAVLERSIRQFAGQNHGLIDRATTFRYGATADSIDRAIQSGRWLVMHPGVYYLNVTEPTWEVNLLAAVLAAGEGARASHRSAGRLWDLDVFATSAIELTVPYSDRPMPAGALIHRTRRSLPSACVKGIPTTSIERTLLDLAAILPMTTVEKACAQAIHKGLTDVDAIALAIREQGGRGVKGTRRLRHALANTADDASGTAAEFDMAGLIRMAPIPQPVPQLEIRLWDGRHLYPDFAWPDRMKIVEVDGHDAHSTPEQLNSDLVRQNMLLDLGWEIRRYSATRIRRHPDEVMRELVTFVGT